jgi:hypothetical protein
LEQSTEWAGALIKIYKYYGGEWIEKISFDTKFNVTSADKYAYFMTLYIDDAGVTKMYRYYFSYHNYDIPSENAKVINAKVIPKNEWSHIEIKNLYSDLGRNFKTKKIIGIELTVYKYGGNSHVINLWVDNFTVYVANSTLINDDGTYDYTIDNAPKGTNIIEVFSYDPRNGFQVENSTVVQVGPLNITIVPNDTLVWDKNVQFNITGNENSMFNRIRILLGSSTLSDEIFDELKLGYQEIVQLDWGTQELTFVVSNPAISVTENVVLRVGDFIISHMINEGSTTELATGGEIFNLTVSDVGATPPKPLTFCVNVSNTVIASYGSSYSIVCIPTTEMSVEFLTTPIGGVVQEFNALIKYEGDFVNTSPIYSGEASLPPQDVVCNHQLSSEEASAITNRINLYYLDLLNAITLGRENKGYLVNVSLSGISSTKYYGGVPTTFNLSVPVGYKVKIIMNNTLVISELNGESVSYLEFNVTQSPTYVTFVPIEPPGGETGTITIQIYDGDNLVNEYVLTYDIGEYTNVNNIIDYSKITNILNKFYLTNLYSLKYLRICGE